MKNGQQIHGWKDFNNLAIMDIAQLIPSEEARSEHVEEICYSILEEMVLIKPISVESRTGVILDGHHRYNALKALGCRLIPVRQCNYFSLDFSFADASLVKSKELVISRALAGKLWRPKSVLHLEQGRLINDMEPTIYMPLMNLQPKVIPIQVASRQHEY